ncbi:Tsr2 protein [Saccharomycopsis crataegensis]|uniref:Tsr2 protein n=1 Tax=Saccharomycopsis crataegensis TaxID=43959 RepID=A0AAV5QKD9_9ASCO|nr:Tsr2 protein [Saccharomycopsis crataegensis]
MSIDHTELVEAPKDQKTLQFVDEKQQANFELGVSMMIHGWDDLKTAVDNQWGGPDSEEKRDWISSIIVELFTTNNAVDISLIEETLLYAMVDEFQVEIEDDSALLVSKRIFDTYKDCREKNYDNVRSLYERWLKKQEQRQINRVVVNEDPQNPDVSDDDDEEDVEEDENIPALVDGDTEMMDIDEEPQQPIVDDDGFELVQKKGRKSRHH